MPSIPYQAQSTQAQTVLRFWLGDAMELGWPSQSRSELWFGGGAELDATVRERFGALVEEAMRGGLAEWEQQPLDCLALVLLLDQFTRNMYRGQSRAFAGDTRAQSLVTNALARGWDDELPLAGTVFLYMPLMHAENIVLQDECVRRFERLVTRAPKERVKDLQGNVEYARQHRDIIAEFGRFPYRNTALGRENVAQELVFLRDGPRFGQ